MDETINLYCAQLDTLKKELQEGIKIVLFIAKFESPKQVICELKKQKLRISKTPSLTTIYRLKK